MAEQSMLFPVSQDELEQHTFRLADLMEEMENAEADFALARDDHKDRIKALKKEMAECKRVIRLAKSQREQSISEDEARRLLAEVAPQATGGLTGREMTVDVR